MSRVQIIGAAWIALAAFSFLITLAFRNDPDQGSQVVGTIVLAALGASLGLWLLVRPMGPAVWISVVGGVVWFIVYAWLVNVQSSELAAWVTDAFLALVGAVLAIASWASR